MTRTLLSIVVVVATTVGCGGADGPTAPTLLTTPTPSALPGRAAITSLGVTGHMVAGRFTYSIRVTIEAGTPGLVLTRIDFQYPESARNTAFSLSHVSMNHAVPPNGSFTSDHDLVSTVAVSQVAVMVSFTDGAGQAGQLSASTTVPPDIPGIPSQTLRIDAYSVTGFMEGSTYAYWPKLTLTASPGDGPVSVTRLQFERPGSSGFFPPIRRNWQIPAGGTVALFHGEFYGEPEFYLTSAARIDELVVTVFYEDNDGRTGNVTAVTTVVR